MRLHEITNTRINESFLHKLHESNVPQPTDYITHVQRRHNFVQIWAKEKPSDTWQGYISAYLIPHEQRDGSSRLVLNPCETFVVPNMRGRGLGTFLYDTLEQVMGQPVEPSNELSDEAVAFWKKRNPELSSDDLKNDRYGPFASYDAKYKIPDPK